MLFLLFLARLLVAACSGLVSFDQNNRTATITTTTYTCQEHVPSICHLYKRQIEYNTFSICKWSLYLK